jgi:hypothetical protein
MVLLRLLLNEFYVLIIISVLLEGTCLFIQLDSIVLLYLHVHNSLRY